MSTQIRGPSPIGIGGESPQANEQRFRREVERAVTELATYITDLQRRLAIAEGTLGDHEARITELE